MPTFSSAAAHRAAHGEGQQRERPARAAASAAVTPAKAARLATTTVVRAKTLPWARLIWRATEYASVKPDRVQRDDRAVGQPVDQQLDQDRTTW